jgi:hypothetical protein
VRGSFGLQDPSGMLEGGWWRRRGQISFVLGGRLWVWLCVWSSGLYLMDDDLELD